MPADFRARFVSLTVGLGAFAFFFPTSASACSVYVTDRSEAATQKRAEHNVERSTAIVDGEVIRSFVEGKQNALVRVHRVLSGPALETLEVGERDSCSIRLDKVGARMRMLLIAGPDVYILQVDQALAEYEDAVLGSDRSVVWPYKSGEDTFR